MLRLAICLFVYSLAAPALAADEADSDTTPVEMCNALPTSAVISGLSSDDAKRVCRAMNLLPSVRTKDIRAFSKAEVVLTHEGYEKTLEDTTKELVQIVRLRGLTNKPDRWYDELNIIVKAYKSFNGLVTPTDVVQFLTSAGPGAKSLSDEGFLNMLIVIKLQKQSDQ